MPMSRRDFARLAAIAGAAGVSLPALQAQVPPIAPPPATEPPPPPVPVAITERARARAAVVVAEFGEHLSAADVEKITSDFSAGDAWLQRFRALPLPNGAEPDFIFVARRPR
jgi:hypothetical protein